MLGAPNDAAGNLSSVALERCRQTLSEYRAASGWTIVPTGGFGAFNRSPEPHAHLTHRWLLDRGVPEGDVLEPVLSRFTAEDAALSRPVVDRYGVQRVKVVSSEVHLERAKLLFETVFSDRQLTFSGCRTHLPRLELDRLLRHEEDAITELRRVSDKR